MADEKSDDPEPCGVEEQETDVDFEKLHTLFVYDELGNKTCFSDIFQNQKTIVVFTRHFHCFVCKDYIEDLGIVPPENLQTANVGIVAIGPAPYKFIQPFKKETNFPYPLYTDPDREVYRALNLRERMVHGDGKNNKHVKQGLLMGTLKSTWNALKVGELEGNIKQQGGAYILGPGDVVHFAHIDETSLDHTPINDLLEKAGVAPVSFPKDKRE